MSKTFIQRIKKIERPTTDPRWLVAIFDESLNSYSGPDFNGILNPEQFKLWREEQDTNTQIIIVEVLENKPQIEIKNYVDAKHPALRSMSKQYIDRMMTVGFFNLVYDFCRPLA